MEACLDAWEKPSYMTRTLDSRQVQPKKRYRVQKLSKLILLRSNIYSTIGHSKNINCPEQSMSCD